MDYLIRNLPYDESMMDFGESPKDVSYWVKKYPGFDPMVHQ
eukprot:CAMPEP_0182914144 /NCGR_PEP_ID=MMETSP0034_2-20130328/38409_1 /TAXON_ID=156128 /ORGANISM="Nephroselmis pyriformis, Strain CCMP717" /LENGTH=40 /DNA_ID= /DNA_START= /DNA_END= /DNA_ORIENTATION=